MSFRVALQSVSKVYSSGTSGARDLARALSENNNENKLTGKVAIDNVTLALHEGERLGIVGRNGAGKSTLLHMIAGISDPTSGKIYVTGKVTSVMTLGIGLRDDFSGRENIYIDGEIQGKSRAEMDQVVEQIIEFAELGNFIDYPVRTYSTGMKARLAFAMITHIEPEILIIDEALSVGDAAFAAKATARILEICAKGKIVILVSHSMQSVRDICNRCLYLKDGRVEMDGAPEVVTKAYIDEVKDEDEAILKKKFAAHIGGKSLIDGYAITSVSLLSGATDTHSLRVETGAKLSIKISANCPNVCSSFFYRVMIVRLDEVVLFDENLSIDDSGFVDRSADLELVFSPFLLAPAIYRLDIQLLRRSSDDVEVFAESATIFEAFSFTPPAGGKPMLYYPVSGSSVPL